VSKARDACAAETFTRGKPRKDKKTGETIRTRFLSDEERALLLHACANSEWVPLHALVLLAITTGALRGELVSLRWVDVDLKPGRATIHDTKNGEQRTLPLAGKALEALRQLKLQNSARSEYLFPSPTVVLDPETGKPRLDAPYEHFDAHWYAALEAAGISGFRFHDVRHTTASMLAAQGESLLEIADVLGHKTLAMVERCSHLVVEHKAKGIERMIVATGL
jgi:integrase